MHTVVDVVAFHDYRVAYKVKRDEHILAAAAVQCFGWVTSGTLLRIIQLEFDDSKGFKSRSKSDRARHIISKLWPIWGWTEDKAAEVMALFVVQQKARPTLPNRTRSRKKRQAKPKVRKPRKASKKTLASTAPRPTSEQLVPAQTLPS